MLHGAKTLEEKNIGATILLNEIGVKPSSGDQYLFWLNPETKQIEWCIGYTSFLGKTCQMHVVNFKKKYTPRKLLEAAFDYPFNQCGCEIVFGTVNSNNEAAMRYDAHLGFKEANRFRGVHDDGGDLVLFQMNKDECRYIKEHKHAA